MNKRIYLDNEDLYGAICEILYEGYEASVIVTGMSMWPFLCHGRDSVVLSSKNVNSLRVGDIVLFRIPEYEKYILHRIVMIDSASKTIQTAGDGNCFLDNVVPMNFVVAKVTKFVRKNQEISVDNKLYIVSSIIWRLLFPVRKHLLYWLRKISRFKVKK